jgi:hypothetical protein
MLYQLVHVAIVKIAYSDRKKTLLFHIRNTIAKCSSHILVDDFLYMLLLIYGTECFPLRRSLLLLKQLYGTNKMTMITLLREMQLQFSNLTT